MEKNLIIDTVSGNGIKELIKVNYKREEILIIRKDKIEELKIGKYEIIIIDDGEEMNREYYEKICKNYKENKGNEGCNICIIGDKRQRIEGDERYLKYGEILLNLNKKEWERINITRSSRLSKEICEFINKSMYKKEIIISEKEIGKKPRYLICDTYGIQPFNEIKYYIEQGYKASDIYILAPSLKNERSPIRILENKIRILMKSISVYRVDEGEEINEEEIGDKIIITTIQQAKGYERKVVILYNFDNSYFTYYNKNVIREECANELYIGVTRGTECLTLIHHNQHDYLTFINEEEIERCCDVRKYKMTKKAKENKKDEDKWENINKIIKDLPDIIIKESLKWLKVLKIQEGKRKGGGDNIKSLVITSYYEYKTKGEMTIINKYKGNNKCLFEENNKLDIKGMKEEEVKNISKIWYKEKNENSEYNEIVEEEINIIKGVKRLDKLKISNSAEYEKRIEIKGMKELINHKLMGYINCEDRCNIYEIRCRSGEIKEEDILELGVKMYINESKKEINNKELEEEELKEKLNKMKEEYIKKEEEKKKRKEIRELREEEEELKEILKNNYKNNDITEGDEIKCKYNGEEIIGKVKIVSNIFRMNEAYIYLYNDNNKYVISKMKDIEYKNINNEKDRYKQYYKNNKCKKEFKKNYERLIEIKKNIGNNIEREGLEGDIKEIEGNILKIENKIKELNKKEIITKESKYYIYNIATNELIEIRSNIKELRKMIEYIIYNKYVNSVGILDNKFIKEELEILKKYL